MPYDLTHLDNAGNNVIGPVQGDELLLLYALCRVLRPKTVLEFGCNDGTSARNFVLATDEDSHVYSVDLDPGCLHRLPAELHRHPRFTLLTKCQTQFAPRDVDHRPIDLVFFDASHSLELNCITMQVVAPCLSEQALLVVHDTGPWTRAGSAGVGGYPQDKLAKVDVFYHQPHELAFAEYLSLTYRRLDLHCLTYFRHGLSLFQRRR